MGCHLSRTLGLVCNIENPICIERMYIAPHTKYNASRDAGDRERQVGRFSFIAHLVSSLLQQQGAYLFDR